MCTAVRIVVAAADRERRLELRRAAVTAEWEVVGEADGPEAAYMEAVERRARFLVLDASAAGPRRRRWRGGSARPARTRS
jgi:hypothetical protein